MIRMLLVPLTALLLGACTLTHYEARGLFGEQPAVLHWKAGDSSVTLWRCEAVPIPLSHGPQGDDVLASRDACISVLADERPATPGALRAGMPVTLVVQCDDQGYPPAGHYPFSAVGQRRQLTAFGIRAPDVPDACAWEDPDTRAAGTPGCSDGGTAAAADSGRSRRDSGC